LFQFFNFGLILWVLCNRNKKEHINPLNLFSLQPIKMFKEKCQIPQKSLSQPFFILSKLYIIGIFLFLIYQITILLYQISCKNLTLRCIPQLFYQLYPYDSMEWMFFRILFWYIRSISNMPNQYYAHGKLSRLTTISSQIDWYYFMSFKLTSHFLLENFEIFAWVVRG
jgi:hypothetical protein